MKKLICFSLFLASLFSGCEPAPKEPAGKLFRANIPGNPHTLDPAKASDTTAHNVIRLLFEGLMRIGPNDKPTFALASSVEISEDMKTYTFELKKSNWSNGDPVTAHDFVYGWRRILSPSFPSDSADALYVVKNALKIKQGKLPQQSLGVSAVDSHTLLVELERPVPNLFELLCYSPFLPINEKADRANPHWADKERTYVSNGPFCLVAWRPDDCIELRKNTAFWDADKVYLSHVFFSMVDADTEFRMYEKGELDWAGSPLSSIPADALSDLRKKGLVTSQPFTGSQFLRVNTRVEQLQDPTLRKAISFAINREEITNEALQGGQTPAFGLVPAKMGLQQAPYFEDGDLERAQALFQKVSHQVVAPISLIYCRSNRNHVVAQVLQEQLRKGLGLQLKLEALDSKVYYSKMAQGDYDMALCNWVADYNDPMNFLEILKSKETGSNRTGWENQRYAELLEESYTQTDPAARFATLAKAEQVMLDEMPIIPLYDLNMLYMHKPHVKNVYISSMGNMELRWASVE